MAPEADWYGIVVNAQPPDPSQRPDTARSRARLSDVKKTWPINREGLLSNNAALDGLRELSTLNLNTNSNPSPKIHQFYQLHKLTKYQDHFQKLRQAQNHSTQPPTMATLQCPVVGTTNSVLPPNHPDIDLDQPGQTCPIVGAKTEHHQNLHQHPSVSVEETTPTLHTASAAACPALKSVINEPKSQAMDDEVCPVIGPATTVLPPDHPRTDDAKEGDVCPVTKATVGHHKGKVHGHPSLLKVEKGAVCPVAGARI